MARISLELEQGEIVRVMGPAKLTVLRGRVMILGAVFSENESVEIDKFRSYGVKAIENAALAVTLGEGSSLEQPVEGEEVIDEWVRVADEIVDAVKGEGGVVIAIGPTDAGKSSFTALLANRGLHAGLRVGVIDADIGQADVGPPGFISATLVDRKILWLRWLKAEELRFIGSIAPHRHERRILAAVVDLYHVLRDRGAQLIAVDSDGWVYGLSALEYKMELIRVLRPAAVVVVGDDSIANVVAGWTRGFKTKVYAVKSPAVVRVRDREDRRTLRSEAYRRFFEGATVRSVKLTEVSVMGSCLFMGELLDQNRLASLSSELGVQVLAGSESVDSLVLVVDKQPRPGVIERLSQEKQVYVITRGSEQGLYVAVLDNEMRERAPGVITSIDYSSLEAQVLTSYQGEIGGLIIGNIRLSIEAGFEEVGRVQRCPL
ncbi:hypothetical protein Pyrfu_0191 [Pyrolobus fumarii 1A]|uniref:polynucleotide 5'-hydroxyl-kinase n=1 Tax=Pyrolobus fumarii (strain DSM 11204 / 1A) TaxID=694429 RepID=G0EEU9_PYRF1|nr:Clp1/GlmU family protein [Pyrolobus fumarii]AEM38063.1 hypothetical protein Pyrfu_0191 [Pyrolobus fumarii 1A]